MRWLYDDAILLRANGRARGCLCLLLCLVDALAKEAMPEVRGNRNRFVAYLKNRLQSVGLDQEFRVEEKNGLVHLAEIFYEYFRCYLVHEGDPRENLAYEIQVEYEDSGRFWFPNSGVLGDRINKQLVFRADWLTEVLLQVTDPAAKA